MAVDIAKSLNIEARINELRDSLGEALRSRVVGPDADTRVQQIMEVGGPRWYSDDRPIRIHVATQRQFRNTANGLHRKHRNSRATGRANL